MTLKRGNRTKSKVTRKQLKGGRRSRSSSSRSSRSRSRGSSGSSGSRRRGNSGSSGSRPQNSDPDVERAIQGAINDAVREAIEAPTTPAESISRLRRIYNDLLEQDINHAGIYRMNRLCSTKRAEVLQLKRNIRSHGTLLQKRELSNILQELRNLCPLDTIFQTANRERF